MNNQKKAGRSRMFRMGSYSLVITAVVLAIAILANVLVSSLPVTMTMLDVTASKRFSLSEQTLSLVQGLEKDVTIYWLVQNGNEDANVSTMLEQYEGLSSHVRVVRKDPELAPTFLEQYELSKVDNNALIVESGEKYRYLGNTDIYDYDYSSYYTTGTANVSFAGELVLTSAIDYCISESLPKLYVLTGHGESDLSLEFRTAIERENIEMETLSLASVQEIPADCSALLVNAPGTDITVEEKQMLQIYLNNGGNMLLLTDPLEAGTLTNLESVMADYGVTVEPGVVVEGNQSNYAWGNPLYLLPNMVYHAVTNPLRNNNYYVMLPVAHGLNVQDDLPATVSVTTLLYTSDEAYCKASGYNMTTYNKEEGDKEGKFALSVAIQNTLDDGLTSEILWVSSAMLVDDDMNTKSNGGNSDFFLNALNWVLEQEESEYTIHTKSTSYEYLSLNSSASTTLSILVVGVIPVCYLIVGVVVLVRRKRK